MMANFIKRIRKTSLSSSANKHESKPWEQSRISLKTFVWHLELLEDEVEGIEDPVVEGNENKKEEETDSITKTGTFIH